MNRDEFLPEGYRWATRQEIYQYCVAGMSLGLRAVYSDPDEENWIGWAIPK